MRKKIKLWYIAVVLLLTVVIHDTLWPKTKRLAWIIGASLGITVGLVLGFSILCGITYGLLILLGPKSLLGQTIICTHWDWNSYWIITLVSSQVFIAGFIVTLVFANPLRSLWRDLRIKWSWARSEAEAKTTAEEDYHAGI